MHQEDGDVLDLLGLNQVSQFALQLDQVDLGDHIHLGKDSAYQSFLPEDLYDDLETVVLPTVCCPVRQFFWTDRRRKACEE